MALFRRRSRDRRVDVGTFTAPERAPLAPMGRVVDDGVAISLWSVRMAIKNRLIVSALRDDAPYDPDALIEATKEEILGVARENEESADRLEGRRETMDELDGDFDLGLGGFAGSRHVAADEDDEHRRRPRVHRLLARALRAQADDPEVLERLVAEARRDAWDDVGREVLVRAAATGFEPAKDEDYEAERDIRLRMFLDFDLAALADQKLADRKAEQPPGRRKKRTAAE